MCLDINSFRGVIKLWPTAAALAREVGGVDVEAVHKWTQRNSIPPGHWPRLLATATAREAGLTSDALMLLLDGRWPRAGL